VQRIVSAPGVSLVSPSRSKRARLAQFLAIVGPGIIVMTGDNDVGAFALYTSAGALYGFNLLWVMLPLLPITYFCQEMVVRLGCATGMGHAAMIFRRFGSFWGWFSLADLMIVNFATIVTEFIGIAAGLGFFGVPAWISVLLTVVFLFTMVSSGAYKRWENAALALVPLNFLVIPAVLALHPNYAEAASHYFRISLPGGLNADIVFLIIGLVGTTIAPWQIFFQQSAIADKGLRIKDIPNARLDLFFGNLVVQLGAFALMVLAATLYYRTSTQLDNPIQIASALVHRSGYTFGALYAIALINAGLIGGVANSLANAWALGEVANVASSLNRKFHEAPLFYLTYAACLGLAGAIILIPKAPLELITTSVQALAAIILPVTIVFLNLLLNDRELLGPVLVNRRWQNVVNWSMIIVLFALSGILAAQTIAPNLFPKTGAA
jgi:Mn2+/Fe2+ NRAMP family transporter